MLKRFLFKRPRYQRLQFLFHFHPYSYDARVLARQLLLRKLHGFHAIHALMLVPRVLPKLWVHHCCAEIPAPKTGILVEAHKSLSCRKYNEILKKTS